MPIKEASKAIYLQLGDKIGGSKWKVWTQHRKQGTSDPFARRADTHPVHKALLHIETFMILMGLLDEERGAARPSSYEIESDAHPSLAVVHTPPIGIEVEVGETMKWRDRYYTVKERNDVGTGFTYILEPK